MSGTRRAALVLNALHADDRSLLMDAVPASQRAQLERYLAEIRELGVEGDAGGMLDAALAGSAGVSGDVLPADPLAAAGADAMAAMLAPEPDLLIAQVLALRPWSWAEAVLEQLPPSRRQNVLALRRDTVDVAPELGRFLAGAMQRRLADIPVPAETDPEPAPAAGAAARALQIFKLKVQAWTR